MSQIIKARELLQSVLDAGTIDPGSRRVIKKALKLMYREPYAQHTKGMKQRINWRMRRTIFRLRGKHTIHEIANIVGLRNSARISEVLHGKR